MNRVTLVAILSLVAVTIAGMTFSIWAFAQPVVQMSMMQMMNQPMPMSKMTSQEMNRMMAQMSRQMVQMETTIKALRAQLGKVNPDLLTGQERPMYEYLKMLQSQLEMMPSMMKTMQGMMQGMMR